MSPKALRLLSILGIMFYSLSFFLFPQSMIANDNTMNLMATLLAVSCIFAWYHFDSTIYNFYERRVGVLIILMALAGVPYYLIKTRGVKKGIAFSLLGLVILYIGGIVNGLVLLLLKG